VTSTVDKGPGASARAPGLAEVLAVPSVGRFYGRCAPGARFWTLRFVADNPVNDFVFYRLGRGPRRTVNLRPGQALTWRLRPGTFRSHEPGFRQVPGDPMTRSSAPVAYLTTTPLSIVISQGSEPRIFLIDVRIALAAAISANCAPVATHLQALTYFNGRPPLTP
jgi:hypothetical protein